MPKNRKAPVYNFNDFRKKLEEEHSLVIHTDAGDFRYRGPALLSDDEMKRMVELEASKDADAAIEVARIMVDDYDGFVAAGGSTTMLMEIVNAEQKRRAGETDDEDAEGERLGESGESSDS